MYDPAYQPYYVGWLTLALINGNLAKSQKRSTWFWFLVSLLLGPVATFILMIL